MRSFLVMLCCLAAALWTPVTVVARTCDAICETTDLWGIGSKTIDYRQCACTDSTTGGSRTGPECGCGGCYVRSNNHIIGQVRINGACPAGTTACDDCDIASSSGSKNSSSTVTTTPTSTTSPTSNSSSSPLTPSSTSSTSGTSGDSTSATGGNLGSPSSNSSSSGSNSSSSSSSGLATWQIALIICSAVLVIAVVTITIMSCYCKARNRMKDNELIEEDTREYEHYWHPSKDDGDDRAGGNHLTNSGFGGSLMQGGRSSFNSNHSRPNSAKNVPYEPSYTADERIGAGRSNRGSLGSNTDLPGIFQPFSQRERPSQEVGSRKNISITL